MKSDRTSKKKNEKIQNEKNLALETSCKFFWFIVGTIYWVKGGAMGRVYNFQQYTHYLVHSKNEKWYYCLFIMNR